MGTTIVWGLPAWGDYDSVRITNRGGLGRSEEYRPKGITRTTETIMRFAGEMLPEPEPRTAHDDASE